MVIRLKVFEQTLSIIDTRAIPRKGSKDYLILQFLFSPDWDGLDKLCYLQRGEVSQPIDVVDNLVEVPEWFTQQDSFDVTLFGKGGSQEVPTNVVSLRLEKSNTLWEQDAPEPQPGWLAKVIDLNNHPPVPGDNGYWLIWDTGRSAYVESELPLPDMSGIPEGGTSGQLLSKTESGTEWIDPPQSGAQSDWNQNDDTAADYVKNRPFYSETKTVTVENATEVALEGFPAFVTGDTVTVNVDGVEHSLVAYYDEAEGVFTVGDTYSSIENGEGQLGWQIYSGGESAWFYATEAHTISYLGVFIYKIDDKFVNLDGLVRTFDYHFKDYRLYKTLYNSAGDKCTLYTCSDFILPDLDSQLFGFMSGLGFSIVDSVDLYSCFITGVKINTINSGISIVRVVLGANTSYMEAMAADYGYTYTTNPNA